jgi:hypothetical protein
VERRDEIRERDVVSRRTRESNRDEWRCVWMQRESNWNRERFLKAESN